MLSHFLRKELYWYALPVIMALTVNGPLFSQILADPEKDREEIFTARIKQFNEFTDRFNLKTDFRGNPADSAFLAKMPRERMLNLLFDLRDPRIQKSGPDYSDDYVQTKKSFIDDVVINNIELHKYSPAIIAEARSKVTYKGEPHKIRVFLIRETTGGSMVKWVIYSARGDILNISKADTSMVRFIPPSSNETDFINLKRALEDTEYLQYYAAQDYKPDNLTLFFSFIMSGQLKFDYVEEVVYHIIDIPGWYLKVKDFNRTELNSGWLITDVRRNNLDISDFIEDLE